MNNPIEGPAVFDQYEDEQFPEFQLSGDTGPTLVVRRACLTPRGSEDDVQRHTLFQSTCTINGKIYTFIIDSETCENVIAQFAVDKLALSSELHHNPYSLSWSQKENSVNVDRRALVQLSVGTKYIDSIWCDIVPMDVCHVLLG